MVSYGQNGSSSFATDGTTQPVTEEIRHEDKASPSSGNFAKFRDYIKSRYENGNWFGSGILLFNMASTYQMLRASLIRKVNNEQQADRIRAFLSFASMGEYTWSFLSSRGAKFPEGETLGKRLIHTIRHPNNSSAQFEFLLYAPLNLLSAYNSITKGLKAHGVGLAAGEKAYAPEKVRLYSGINRLLITSCLGYGHFRKHARGKHLEEGLENPENFGGVLPNASSDHSKGILGILEKIWNHDRILLVGGVLKTANDCLGLIEGWAKTGKSRGEANRLLKSAALGMVADMAYYYYMFQRITTSNLGTKPHAIAQASQTEEMEKEKGEDIPTGNEKKLSFTDRVATQKSNEHMHSAPSM